MNRLRSYLRTNIATKLVATVLSLVLFISAFPIAASAEAVVAATDITIGTAAPMNGANIADGTNAFGGGSMVVKWSTDGTNYSPASGTFAQSTVYRTRYVLTADSGHVFDPAAGIYQSGGAQDLSSRIGNLGSGTFTATVSQGFTLNDTLTIVVTWQDATIQPGDISIGTLAPVAGATIADGTNTFKHATAVVSWSSTGSNFVPASGTFAPDTTYFAQYVITAEAGFAFDNTGRIYQDGAKSLASRIFNLGTAFLAGASVSTNARANDTLKVTVQWDTTEADTSQGFVRANDITIGTLAPTPAASVTDGTNVFNHASLDYIEWFRVESGLVPIATGSTFVSGKTYQTDYVIKPASGYAFDTPTAYMKGGARDLSSRIANLGSGTFYVSLSDDELIVSVTWPVAGLIVPGDISIGTAAPVADANMADGTNTFSHSPALIRWSSDNGANYAAASGSFAYETTYKTKYELYAASGYSFDSTAGIYASGAAKSLASRIANLGSGTYTAVVSGSAHDTLTIEITWPKTAAAPQTTINPGGLSVGTIAPDTGAAMASGTSTFPHTASSVTWSGDNGSSYAAASGTYAPGTAYRTKYVLKADAGFIFDSTAGAYDAVAVPNLSTGTFTALVSTTSTSNDTLTITVTWPATAMANIAAADLAIGTIAPVSGENIANGSNTFGHATAAVSWSGDGGTNYGAAAGVFAPNTAYKTKYVITANSGYRFDSSANFYDSVSIANIGAGSVTTEVATTNTSNDTLTIIVAWPSTGAATIAASDISIGTSAPVTGATQADGTNAFGHGTSDITWSGNGGSTYGAASGKFAAVNVYKTKYVLTASAGYVFDGTPGAYDKNGASDLSGRIVHLGSGTFAATVSTTSTSGDTLTIVVTWPVTGAVTILPADIAIGTAAPVTGAAQSNGTNVFDHAAASISWSADNGSSYQSASGTFALGTSYRTKYVLTSTSEYLFDATPGAYHAISIANLGTGTFTTGVSTDNDTLTIIVTWPPTAVSDTVKFNSNDTSDFQAYSGNTLIPAQGLSVAAEDDYGITLVNGSIDSTNPSAPLTASMVKNLSVVDNAGNSVLKSVQVVSSGVAQNHPWSLKIAIAKNSSLSARTITVSVNADTAQRIDIRNLIGFTSPTISFANLPNIRSAFPYEYGNYYYFLPGDYLAMQTTSSGLIPAGVQLVGKNTSKTTPVTNTQFDTTNYKFGYTFTMPNEPVFMSVTSTDGKAAHGITVKATIPGVVTPKLSGGSTFVQATAKALAMDNSGDMVTVDPGNYSHRLYKVTGIEVRSELLNVSLPFTANPNGTYSFAMPFTDAIVTVLVERVVSNPVQAEITNNSNAQATVDLEDYYPGDTINVQIENKDPAKYVTSVVVFRVYQSSNLQITQSIRPANRYDSRMNVAFTPYASTEQLMAGATLKAVVNFGVITIPVTTASPSQFSNFPTLVDLNQSFTVSFSPPNDPSKIYTPEVKLRDAVNGNGNATTVIACTYLRTDSQDQTKSVYTCPAVTKNSTSSVELLYDSVDASGTSGGTGTTPGVKLRNIASIAPNSKLAGVFKSIVVYGTNMNGSGKVYIGTSPNPTLEATVSDITATSLVIKVPENMLSSRMDVTYFVSSNGVQRSVTIASAQTLSHTTFGSLAVVTDSQRNHSVIVSESEKDLQQQLGNRVPIIKMKGSFTANATIVGAYDFTGTTIINGSVTSNMATGESKIRVRDYADGNVTITMNDVNIVAGTYSIMAGSDGAIDLEQGVQYVDEYAKDEDGELLDDNKQNIEMAIRNQNKLIVLGSGMQVAVTGVTLLKNAVMFDGKVYFGMALPGSSNVGFGLNIDRLQYGVDGSGSMSFQGVKADGSFTPGTDFSRVLGGFNMSATAEGSIDTFANNYALAFDVDAKLANFAASMSLKKNGSTGQFIPNTIKIVVGLGAGIPITPMVPIAKLTRVGGGVTGLADTISGNYKGIAPILILLDGDLEVGSLLPGHGLLEFNDVELAIGPSQISLSGNPTLLKMEIFDKFQAGIYVTNTSVSYQMQVAANILKNFSVILAGGNVNLTYYRTGNFNLNGQLYGRLQIPSIDVGLFDIGPYTISNTNVGLSNSNAYAAFSILGFGLKVDYSFGSGSVDVRSRSLAAPLTTGQKVYDENGNAVGQLNAMSNISLVASSAPTNNRLRALTATSTPTITTDEFRKTHTVTIPEGGTEDYALLVSAAQDDLSILDPDGNPYGLTYPGTLSDGTPYYDDPNANAAVVSDHTIMIRLGAQAGAWTISSSKAFDSSIIAIAPIPQIADTTFDAGTHATHWDLKGLDTANENYRVEVRLSADNGDDPKAASAGVLVHAVDVDAAQATDGVASGSYAFTAEDLGYLQSGTYYPRITLIGTPKSDSSKTIPYASLNAKQALDVVNPHAPASVSAVSVSAGGGGSIHAAWSGVAGADGYLVSLLDADGNTVMSPMTYTDERDNGGNPTGEQTAHAGRPIAYQIPSSYAKDGEFTLDFGGMESGNSYKLMVTPYASINDDESAGAADFADAVYIYGAPTVTDVVDVPLVKMPVLHVSPSAGIVTNDSFTGNTLTVNGDFTLDVATTYVDGVDGKSKDSDVKFTVWQSDGTINEQTDQPNYTRIYASAEYENHISVPVALAGDVGSSLIRIVAENAQGDESDYGLAVQYNSLPLALFVETDANGKIVADSAGRYKIQGSTVAYATVMDNFGNRTTADDEGQFSISDTLSGNAQTYSTITAIDHSGNFAQDDVTIVKGNVPTGSGNGSGTDTGSGTGPGTGSGTGDGTDGGNPSKPTFKDVHAQAPWAEAAIERAVKLGIVSGRTPGFFAPNSDTKRAEAIAMLVRAQHLTVGTQADLDAAAAYFADWNELAGWSKPYIAAAFANGLVSGATRNGKHYINGGSSITRAEVAVLFQNAFGLKADASNRKSFQDAVPSWAAASVDALSSNGVINGYPNATFKPDAEATRAEIVVMLMRLIDLPPVK